MPVSLSKPATTSPADVVELMTQRGYTAYRRLPANPDDSAATIGMAFTHPSMPVGHSIMVTTPVETSSLAFTGEHATDDARVFNGLIDRLEHHMPHIASARVFMGMRTPNQPDKPWRDSGWLEHTLMLDYANGKSMLIAVIQRKPGDVVEAHS